LLIPTPQRASCSRSCADQWPKVKLRHAYTGTTNTAFTRAGGSVDEYSVGMKHAAAQKWFEIDTSGTRIVLPADGAE
jgi:hypothetical protein